MVRHQVGINEIDGPPVAFFHFQGHRVTYRHENLRVQYVEGGEGEAMDILFGMVVTAMAMLAQEACDQSIKNMAMDPMVIWRKRPTYRTENGVAECSFRYAIWPHEEHPYVGD